MTWKIVVPLMKDARLWTFSQYRCVPLCGNTTPLLNVNCTTEEDVIFTWRYDGDSKATGRCWSACFEVEREWKDVCNFFLIVILDCCGISKGKNISCVSVYCSDDTRSYISCNYVQPSWLARKQWMQPKSGHDCEKIGSTDRNSHKNV